MQLNLKEKKKAEKYFELTMLDGTTVTIRKPSEEMVIMLEDTEIKLRDQTKFKGAIDLIRDQVIKILNHNKEGKVFDALLFNIKDEDGEPLYDYNMCMAIYKAYCQFYTEVLSNPN